jgi:hypothetical protein
LEVTTSGKSSEVMQDDVIAKIREHQQNSLHPRYEKIRVLDYSELAAKYKLFPSISIVGRKP